MSHTTAPTPLQRALARRDEIHAIAAESAAAIRQTLPECPYEAAAARYRKAVEDYSTVKARAAKLIDDADGELAAAEADLRQHEERPGIPLPQYRTAVAS
jgi:hypothetical protein